MEKVIINRQELYHMVWKEPMTTLAKRYSISDNGLRKICIKLQVPLPKKGHWMKVKAGKKVKVTPLPLTYKGEQEVRLTVREDGEAYDPTGLSALARVQRDLEDHNRDLITVPDTIKRPDPLIVAAKEVFDREKKKRSYNGLYSCMRSLNIHASPATAARAFRFMDTLIKALKALGNDVVVEYQSTYAVIESERFEIGVREKLTKYTIKCGTWDSSEYKPSGLLSFWYKNFGTKEWADGKKPLEDRLSRIIATLQLKGKQEHAERLERERKQAEREERERTYREMEARQEKELANLNNILVEAERWRQAKVMRDYANEVERAARNNNIYTEQLGEWAEWVRKKADWHDPQVKRQDELLTEVDWETLNLKKKPSYFFW
ncbi:hypothetical protein ACMA1I_20225 [Pontibacter sp. 13R65]|uniref:hypothetical protein n=1 Tax=Pontibacter sp. 13R65 TaxID=3127458 RepID=UPI00301D860C